MAGPFGARMRPTRRATISRLRKRMRKRLRKEVQRRRQRGRRSGEGAAVATMRAPPTCARGAASNPSANKLGSVAVAGARTEETGRGCSAGGTRILNAASHPHAATIMSIRRNLCGLAILTHATAGRRAQLASRCERAAWQMECPNWASAAGAWWSGEPETPSARDLERSRCPGKSLVSTLPSKTANASERARGGYNDSSNIDWGNAQ